MTSYNIIRTSIKAGNMAEEFSGWLEELKSRISIVDVVGSYTTLTRKGGRYWACCPFHNEKTPSFTVDDSRGSFYCFGCHKGGDAISFVKEIDHTDFMGAVTILARKAGMTVPEFSSGKSSDRGLSKNHRDRLYALMRESAAFYNKSLMSDQGAAARRYLSERGLSDRTIKAFGMGYAPHDALIRHLAACGYTEAEMLEAGVAGENSKGSLYDVQSGRVIVPIINNLKQVVAFGGRVTESGKQPKYRNTKETVIFDKSRELFGQHTIKKAMIEGAVDSVIMVEGYMDVISLYQAGIKNCMASMGTALTQKQAKLLKRYADKIYISYDGDEAGQKATMRGLDILYDEGLNVKVVTMPDCKDPDEYVRKYGKKGYLDLLACAKPLFEYKLDKLAEGYDFSVAEDRGKYAVEAAEILHSLKNPAQVDVYIDYISAKTNIPKPVLLKQYAQSGSGEEKQLPQKAFTVKQGKYYTAMRYILYALFSGADNLPQTDITQYIEDDEHRAIYNEYMRIRSVSEPCQDDLQAMEGKYPEVAEIFNAGKKVTEEQSMQVYRDCLASLEKERFNKEMREVSERIDKEKDPGKRSILLAQYAELKAKSIKKQ